MSHETFGIFIKQAREDNNLSLRELANITGVSHTYISSLEKGRDPRTERVREPSFDTIRKLSEGLDVNYYLLLSILGFINLNDDKLRRLIYKH